MKIWILGILGIVAISAYTNVVRTCVSGSSRVGSLLTHTKSSSGSALRASESEQFVPFEKALSDAKTQNKLVLVDVYTDWCGWCKKLDRDVYPSAEVQKELKTYFTATKIDAESQAVHFYNGKQLTERQLAAGWAVSGYPTILFLDANGNVLRIISGYHPPSEFAQLLRYIGTHTFEHKTFEEWQSEKS
ncbi:MAG: thioredoxin fold domain-containing protein [Candidatus Kapaibacterium sp.]|jgi:thioredoxin-related protein